MNLSYSKHKTKGLLVCWILEDINTLSISEVLQTDSHISSTLPRWKKNEIIGLI